MSVVNKSLPSIDISDLVETDVYGQASSDTYKAISAKREIALRAMKKMKLNKMTIPVEVGTVAYNAIITLKD